MGYASVVTDSRLPAWWRMYVGQCSRPWRRIVCQHSQAILQGSKSSLHYYMLWMGNGNRAASFIRLWKFPKETPNDSWYQIRSNILEALFCRAFRTHHGILCGTDKPNENTRSFGLNIMSPLVQGNVMLSQLLRVQASVGPSRSPDPQIRHWAVFNPTHNKAIRIKGRPFFRCNFDTALRTALGGSQAFFLSVKKSLQLKSTANTHAKIETIPFVG